MRFVLRSEGVTANSDIRFWTAVVRRCECSRRDSHSSSVARALAKRRRKKKIPDKRIPPNRSVKLPRRTESHVRYRQRVRVSFGCR